MQGALPSRRYQIGEFVRRISAPDQAGQVKGAGWNDGAEVWQYQVRFLNGLRTVFEDDLVLVDDEVEQHSAAGARAFRTLITFERLHRPASRIAASFGTARAAFYPYQFIPLLKFMESENNRLLVADDVGLGKTIEAGYILRELRARKSIDQVLIVVPARLTYKWKEELERRFDERFEIVRRRDFHRLFQSMAANRDPRPVSWITSYEAIRARTIQSEFEEWAPAFDLVILDEAHRVRNPNTLQHKVARALGDCAEALVFLTATPVQTGIEDLFNLLRILMLDYDLPFALFHSLYEANRPIVRALAALREVPPDAVSARLHLEQFAKQSMTVDLAARPFFRSIVERLDASLLRDRRERVALQRDIGELSLFGKTLSRTRKVEVLPNRPVRVAQSARVRLTLPERRILDEYAERVADARGEEWGDQMRALMDYRYVASSIKGAMAHFRKREKEQWRLDQELTVATESVSGWLGGIRAERVERGPENDRVRMPQVLPTDTSSDSKLGVLQEVLAKTWLDDRARNERPRKVVVFSFFRETLNYLSSQFRGAGVEHRLISGEVSIVERERRIDEFLTREEVNVLLSSEVGSEGLDLQAASVVVNYDLPWNPMVVEQRIGRLDRIGQRSPKIVIVNLVTEDTIEETILERLYRRIAVFRESIGDLEEILGDVVEELVIEALQQRLTEEEVIARAEQTAEALERRIGEARDLQRRADEMLAADQAFLDEIDAIVEERRVPNPRELHRFLAGYFADHYRGVHLPESAIDGVGEAELVPEVAHDLERFVHEADARRIANRIHRGPFPVSFAAEAVLDAPRAELIGFGHPLVRLAVEQLASERKTAYRRFAVGLTPSECIRPGIYAFDIRRFEIAGVRERSDVVPFVYSFASRSLLPEDGARTLLIAMIDDGQDLLRSIEDLAVDLESGAAVLCKAVEREHARIDRDERRLEEGRADQRRSVLQSQLESRLAAEERRLLSLRYRSAKTHAIRSAEGRVRAATERLEAFRKSSTVAVGQAACQVGEIAKGVLVVE